MAKYKSYDYSQRVSDSRLSDEQLMPGNLEFAIHTLVHTRIDTSIFDQRYNNDETGREAYDPKVLLTVVLFGYQGHDRHRGRLSVRAKRMWCLWRFPVAATRSQHDSGLCLIDEGKRFCSVQGCAVGL